jgi:hypothetical protein
MTYKLSFNSREAEPYTGLEDEEDVYAAIKEEASKVVSDGGAFMYEPVYSNPGHLDPVLRDAMSESDRAQVDNEAHQTGMEQATAYWAVRAKEELWTMELDEGPTKFKFPDGTTIILTMEED